MGETIDQASATPTDELADLPGFATTSGPDPLDPEATTITGPPPSPDLDLEDWSDVDEEEPRPASAARSASTTASTDWHDLVPLAATLVGLGSMAVRWIRGRRRELPEGAWIADEDDQAAIAGPLARIAARRSPVGGKESADLVDGVELLVGATGYAMKNLEREVSGAGYAMKNLEREADE